MDEKQLFTNFWVNESETTRKVLARIPEGSTYKPDPKSRTAQEIAWQIVCEEKMIIEALETRQGRVGAAADADVDEGNRGHLRQAERGHRRAAGRHCRPIAGPAALEFFGHSRPASPMAWSFLFDIVHHRGQITTYLRPMGSTVPQIYGPSGDEP